jgi:hypothetical protein
MTNLKVSSVHFDSDQEFDKSLSLKSFLPSGEDRHHQWTR